jgi:hypothetical protein
MSPKLPAAKPLWGFGIMGWLALPVLLALVVIVLAGYDLQYALIWTLGDLFGAKGAIYYVLGFQAGLYFSMGDVGFNILDVMVVWVAAAVYPRRVSRVALVVLLLWTFAMSNLYVRGWVRSLIFDDPTRAWPAQNSDVIILSFVLAMITALILFWITRSLRTAAAVFLLQAVGVSVYVVANLSTQPIDVRWYFTVPWHMALASIVFTWAIYHRRRPSDPDSCPSCGYLVAGSNQAQCPECGLILGAPNR